MNKQCIDCEERGLGCEEANDGTCTGYVKRAPRGAPNNSPRRSSAVGYGHPGMYKVADKDELEVDSCLGWTCIERFSVLEQARDQYGTPATVSVCTPNGGSSDTPVMTKSPRFVMFMDERAAHGKIAADLAAAKETIEALTNEKKASEKAASESALEIETLSKRIEYRTADLSNEREARRAVEAKIRKMEEDLGSARAELAAVKVAIGSQRLHEILAQAEKQG
jgi:hypothetical protein